MNILKKDSSWHGAFAGYMGCLGNLFMGTLAVGASVYVALHQNNLQVSLFGLSEAVSAWILRWLPVGICLTCSTIAVIVHFRTIKRLEAPANPLITADDLHKLREENKNLTDGQTAALERAATCLRDNKKLNDEILRIERANSIVTKKLDDCYHNHQESVDDKERLQRYITDHIDVQLILDPKKPFSFDTKRENLRIHSGKNVDLEVIRHKSNDLHGLILYIVNLTDQWIGQYNARIVDINAWSDTHNKFLPSKDFPALTLNEGKDIGPMQRSGSSWIVNHQFLPVIEGKLQPALKLPGNKSLDWNFTEQTTTEVWRVSIQYTYLIGATQHESQGAFLIQWERKIGNLDFGSNPT